MNKDTLNENEEKIIDEVKDNEFREELIEGFLNGTYMTVDEFCQRLETLKASLINKHKIKTETFLHKATTNTAMD